MTGSRIRVRGVAASCVLLAATNALSARAAWTDTDCRRWEGTPQYAECARAYEQLAGSDAPRVHEIETGHLHVEGPLFLAELRRTRSPASCQ